MASLKVKKQEATGGEGAQSTETTPKTPKFSEKSRKDRSKQIRAGADSEICSRNKTAGTEEELKLNITGGNEPGAAASD